jgi:hypothetical protein
VRRRWPPVAAVLVAAGCSASSGVANVSSEQIGEETRTTTSPTPPGSAPDFTIPVPPEQSTSQPPTTETQPPGSTPGDTVLPDALPMPDDCVPLPDDAPSLLVTGIDGVVYQVGAGGTQIVADSDGLAAPIATAWRAEGGTLWVSLGLGSSLGRLDAGTYHESGSGDVSLQHVGVLGGEPVALWLEMSEAGEAGAAEGGRIVVEHADGRQDDLGPAWSPDGTVRVGNIGADTVLLTRSVDGELVFDYLDGEGRPAHADWFDPTERSANDVERSSAAVSDDGRTLVWTERDAPVLAVPGDLELVIGRTSGPEVQSRATLAGPDVSQSTGDFDGRWAVASFVTLFGSEPTVLVDTTAESPEAIVPCIPLGAATIDRAGGGDSTPPTTPPTTDAPSTTSAPPAPPVPAPPGSVPSPPGDPIDP